MEPTQSYESVVEVSERVAWRLADVLGKEKFDFSRRFLPESLAQVNGIGCLSDAEKVKLNQIRGLTYAHLFGFVEEFIVKQISALAQTYGNDKLTERRALSRFVEEEVKHQILFERTKAALLVGLGDCGLVPGAGDVAAFVLQKSPLAVMLLIDALEWMTQAHYTDIFRSSEERESLDPTFVELFKAHWLEEAQHAKLDGLEIVRIATPLSPADRDKAVDELLEIGGAFVGLLKSQGELDIASLERLARRSFTDAEKQEILDVQHRAYKYTFLVTALQHKNFLDLLGTLTREGAKRIADAAQALSV